MIDLAKARRLMVDQQVRPVDVTDHAVLAALVDVPRERFVPAPLRYLAFADGDIPLGSTAAGPRAMPSPAAIGRLVQAAAVTPDDVVLDVGANTGYGAAVLARLASLVVALEQDPELALQASDALAAVGADNAAVVTGELAVGYAAEGPYDAILLEGAVEFVPEELFAQLKDGGRLVAVIGHGGSARAILYTRTADDVAGRALFNLSLPALPGFARAPAFVF